MRQGPGRAGARDRTVSDVFADLVRHSLIQGPWSKAAVHHLARWPPDAFAFTSAVLAESGAYRTVISPPGMRCWPPSDQWRDAVTRLAGAWRIFALGRSRMPRELSRLLAQIHGMGSLPVRALCQDDHWDSVCALLSLHAAADESCGDVGIPIASLIPPEQPMQPERIMFLMIANDRIARKGTLSNVSVETMRVMPKVRTPQVGISLRSLSHHLSVHRGEVDVQWMMAEGGLAEEAAAPHVEGHLNLLLIPAPHSLENTAFRPATNDQLENMDTRRFGFFDFQPAQALDVKRVTAAIDEATRRVRMVHGVVFPEGALTDVEIKHLKRVLLRRSDRSPRFIIAGVRGPQRNEAELAIRYKSRWRAWRQNKHHRWCLDEAQIRTYQLTSVLHPKMRWWENIDVTQRQLSFVTVNGWLTFCHLICEDLARQDPVAQSVRAVGPNLVVALLQDGPQLRSRWPARYAGVLADDPGCSVLTLTSLGMSLRSRPPGLPPSRVIAMWKDPQQGEKEISLDEGSTAVILTACADQSVQEWTADGRSDGGTSALLTFGGYEQISAAPVRAPRRRRARPDAPAPRYP